MRRLVLLAIGVACLAVPAAAQSVDEIVAKHVEARGGRQKLKAIQTIKITRTVATPFSDVRVILYKKRPNLFRAEQGPVKSAAALTPRGVNAEAAWDTGPGGQVVKRPDDAAAEARDLDG